MAARPAWYALKWRTLTRRERRPTPYPGQVPHGPSLRAGRPACRRNSCRRSGPEGLPVDPRPAYDSRRVVVRIADDRTDRHRVGIGRLVADRPLSGRFEVRRDRLVLALAGRLGQKDRGRRGVLRLLRWV